MKKIGVFILIVLLCVSFVYAQEMPESPALEGDVEKIQEGVEIIPIKETGELDEEKIGGMKSKAEQRIDKINEWLDDKASWLSLFLGMRPEISWLFTINMFILLLFLNFLVFNANSLFIFLSNENLRIGLGAIIFISLLVSKIFLNMAIFIHDFQLTDKWYGILIKIALIIALAILGTYALRIMKKRREQTEKERTETSGKAIQRMAKRATAEA